MCALAKSFLCFVLHGEGDHGVDSVSGWEVPSGAPRQVLACDGSASLTGDSHYAAGALVRGAYCSRTASLMDIAFVSFACSERLPRRN